MIRTISLLLLAAAAQAAEPATLIRNVTVHPVSAAPIPNGMVLIQGGKIAAVGTKLSAAGAKVIDGKGGHLYPGMINSATELGLEEISSVRETVDTGELGVFNPQLRALIAINPESEFIPVTRANGMTAAITLPATSGRSSLRSAGATPLIAGQASMIRLSGWTWEEMEIRRAAALQILFPTIETRTFSMVEMAPGRSPYSEAKKFFEKRVKELNDYFESARAYQKAKAAPSPGFRTDLALEAMIPVLEGKLPVLIFARDERTIQAAIQFADKQKIRAILADVQRPGAQLAEIAKRKIPVILGDSTRLPEEEDDAYDKNYSLAADLHKAGVKFAFATLDNQFARNLPFEAGFAVGYGLPVDAAVKAVTLDAAEIWGVADELGSIEKGKRADLILTDGDLLEHRTQVKAMWIDGQPVPLDNKHTRLYDKYTARP
jgi:imidazolonepropionase-like amidohydrolase